MESIYRCIIVFVVAFDPRKRRLLDVAVLELYADLIYFFYVFVRVLMNKKRWIFCSYDVKLQLLIKAVNLSVSRCVLEGH